MSAPSRTRRSALVLVVTPGERATLRAWTRSRTLPFPQVRAAQIVLGVAAGDSIVSVAQTLGLHRRHVYRWLRRWQAAGLAGLRPRRRGTPGGAP